MTMKNGKSKPVKDAIKKDAIKEVNNDISITLTPYSKMIVGVLIELGITSGKVKVKIQETGEELSIAELAIDLKRSIQSQLK